MEAIDISNNQYTLSSEEINFFHSYGFLVIRGALSQSQLDSLTQAGDEIMYSDDTIGRDQEDYSDGFRNCCEMHKEFANLISYCPGVIPILQLLGPHIHFSSSHLIYQPPMNSENDWKPSWHSDIYGVEQDLGYANMPRLGIKIGYCLSDHSTPNSGMTRIVPGSHLLKTKLHIPDGEKEPYNAVELSLKAGDAFLFENRTRHSAGINLSGQERKCAIFGYTYRWVNPLDTLINPGILATKIDDLGRALLPGLEFLEDGFISSNLSGASLRRFFDKYNLTYTPQP